MASSEHLRHLLGAALLMWIYYYIAMTTLAAGVFAFSASSPKAARIFWSAIALASLIYVGFVGVIVTLMVFYIKGWRSSKVGVKALTGPLLMVADTAKAAALSIKAIHDAARAVADAAWVAADTCRSLHDIIEAANVVIAEIQPDVVIAEIQPDVDIAEIQPDVDIAALAQAVTNSAQAIADLLQQSQLQPQTQMPQQMTENERNIDKGLKKLEDKIQQQNLRENNIASQQHFFTLITGTVFSILVASAFLGVVITIIVKVT